MPLIADAEPSLPPDEREVPAELEQEGLELADERILDVALRVLVDDAPADLPVGLRQDRVDGARRRFPRRLEQRDDLRHDSVELSGHTRPRIPYVRKSGRRAGFPDARARAAQRAPSRVRARARAHLRENHVTHSSNRSPACGREEQVRCRRVSRIDRVVLVIQRNDIVQARGAAPAVR